MSTPMVGGITYHDDFPQEYLEIFNKFIPEIKSKASVPEDSDHEILKFGTQVVSGILLHVELKLSEKIVNAKVWIKPGMKDIELVSVE